MAAQNIDSSLPSNNNDGGSILAAGSSVSHSLNQIGLSEKGASFNLLSGPASSNRGHSFITGASIGSVDDHVKLIEGSIADLILDRPNSKISDRYPSQANPLSSAGNPANVHYEWTGIVDLSTGAVEAMSGLLNVTPSYGISQQIDNSIYSATVTYKQGGTIASGLKYQ